MIWRQLVYKRPIIETGELSTPRVGLSRCLTRFDLVIIGVAQIIGAGIFVISGVGVGIAGPGIIFSFVLAGLTAVLAALCYAELASMMPKAGGAYSYVYAIFGEVFAWIIGWDLILEYGMAAGAVASGWSHYFQAFLKGFDLHLPQWATADPLSQPGAVINLPAALVVLCLAALLVFRTRMNALAARGLVFLKLGIIGFIIVVGAFYVQPDNWFPLLPYGGFSIIQGASLVFFAYLGFDVVSVTAEEAQHPQRDVPFGILYSLLLCTVIYLLVTMVLLGMAPYTEIDQGSPFTSVFRRLGMDWAAGLVAVGALGGITSVLYVLLLAQPRVLFTMGRDGLLPAWTAKVHPRYQTPHIMTMVCGVLVALAGALTPIEKLAFLCNIGTLFAFFIVCLGVFILRWTQPDLPCPFRIRGGKIIALFGSLASLGLMLSMPPESWLRLGLWLILGLVLYFFFGLASGRLRGGDNP